MWNRRCFYEVIWNDRHEILNEVDQSGFDDLLTWMEKRKDR